MSSLRSKPCTYTGLVVQRLWAAGSKSQQQAVCLQTEQGPVYRLRLAGAKTYTQPEFEAFVGQTVRATGELLHGNTLLIADISALSPIS